MRITHRRTLLSLAGIASLVSALAIAVPGSSAALAGGTVWKNVGTGTAHSCAIKGDNTLWCWGLNNHGQLGIGSTDSADSPQQVGWSTWQRMNLGADYTCAIAANLSLWCWGANGSYQLGQGDQADRTTPTQVGDENAWRQVSAGGSHSCGIKTDGTLWCWGANGSGQVGIGSGDPYVTLPTQVGDDHTWRLVRAGSYHTCALKADESLWCWGMNTSGQLGVGDTTDRSEPTQVAGTWTKVLTGTNGYHTCGEQSPTGVKVESTLWCWGLNEQGQLGLGDQVNRDVPTQVGSDTDWVSLALGYHHSCALRAVHGPTRTLWCWGQNDFGQLGLGDQKRHKTPTMVSGTRWEEASAGVAHTCGITSRNALYCWGSNSDGQLGTGDTSDRLSPTRVW